ncbi:amino acid adenylation domain-containing protein [Streptomyces sp. NPDC005953]|uniref:amino acid adenylation domain-containing protein n=1 Tax=Streptomyces sp. NPDC005953 TaxID=3156719 RepID=UPI0033D98B17
MDSRSYAQRQRQFSQQLDRLTCQRNESLLFDIFGDLDSLALAYAYGDVVERHHKSGSTTTQVLVERKVTGSEMDQIATAEAARPFNLAADPPIRATLFARKAGGYRLQLVLHQSAVNTWSVSSLLRDLGTSYSARRLGRAPAFEPSVSHDASPPSERNLAFWRAALADLPHQLDLPFDNARTDAVEHHTASIGFTITPQTHSRLVTIADTMGSSMFVVGQAALVTWLSCLGAGLDLPVCTAFGGWSEACCEGLVGPALDQAVLRHDLAGDPTFSELVRRAQLTTSAASDHGALPFGQVMDLVSPGGVAAARHSPFQVVYRWQASHDCSGGLELDGMRVEAASAQEDAIMFDLSLRLDGPEAEDNMARMRGALGYDRSLFDQDTAQSLAAMFVTLLEQIAGDPERRLSDFDLVGADLRRRVGGTWNQTDVEVGATDLPTMFSEQVGRSPDSMAVESDDVMLTYAELNSSANQLAHLLIQRDAGPESRVAVIVPRATALVAMLAVLKAGATFLPIDPAYPSERIAFILNDANPDLLLTTSEFTFEEYAQILLDEPDIANALQACPITDPTPDDRLGPLHPDLPAYVVYTSGSTGRPKGVVVTAKVLLNLLSWQVRAINCRSGTRVSQFSAVSFDAFEEEILAALFSGQTIVVPSEDVRHDPAELVRWLQRSAISQFQAPDSVLRLVIDEALERGQHLLHLRTLVQGGEPLQLTEKMGEFHRRHPGLTVWNQYGPSETHVSTAWMLPDDPSRWPAVAPIGKPIWNCQTYVLDMRLRPLPVGVAGELYLAGSALGRGYLDRPGMTSERFVANPFGAPGERMYRTGDVVHWNRSGDLVFVGRADDQIKIHGVRIELNEINTALRRHPHVAEAATIVHEEEAGVRRLISYIVPVPPHRPDRTDLRRHVAAQLPVAFLPSTYVTLDALPLNSNGKLDRLALPALEFSPLERKIEAAGESPIVDTLCTVFCEVLGVSAVRASESFFDLGGHSMLAVRLVKRVRAALGVELGIRAVFQHPTAAGLAEALVTVAEKAHRPLSPMARPNRVPLSFTQRRLWFIDQLEGPSPVYNLPLLVLRLRGELDRSALQAALTDVVIRHEGMRTVFPNVGGRPYQRVLNPDEATVQLGYFEVNSDNLDDEIRRICNYEFDLANELLVRAELFRLSPQEHAFVLVAHHIVADGWSIPPLYRDLAIAYTARKQGRNSGLVPLPVQYADFTLWQQEILGQIDDPDSTLARQLELWRRTLTGLPEVLTLPSDRPRPEEISSRGASLEFVVNANLYSRVQSLARAEKATPFMVLHAGLAALLTLSGAGSDIPVAAFVAGRPDALLDDMIGCFVNMVVLRVDTSGDPSFRVLLARTRESDLKAFQNQDLPFESLVELLNPRRSPSHHPLYQVAITMETGGQYLDLPDLVSHDLEVQTTVSSRTDMSFGFLERSETGSLSGTVEYSTDLFDHDTVETFVARFIALLDEVASKPDTRLWSLKWS